MTEAAEIGTRKVIAEHSTIGIVVTTDGSITDIPREDYLEAEERVITELKELGKPFLVVLNSSYPNSDRAQAIRADIASRYDVTCVRRLPGAGRGGGNRHHQGVLYEFPVKELDLFLPLGGRPALRPPHQERPVYGHPGGRPGCTASGMWSVRSPPLGSATLSAAPVSPPSAWAPAWPPPSWSCPGAVLRYALRAVRLHHPRRW